LECEKDVGSTITSTPIIEDDLKYYKKSFKWSGISHISALFILLLLGFILKPDKAEEMTVVTVVPQKRELKINEKRNIVNVSKNKIKKVKKINFFKKRKKVVKTKTRMKTKNIVKSKVRPKKIVVVKNRIKSGTQAAKNARSQRTRIQKSRIKEMGALGALGAAGVGPKGANLENVGKSGGSGARKGPGKGVGVSPLYGKGLVNSAYGNGHKVGRYNKGYGTRGLGGGGSDDYGSRKIRASSGESILTPLTEEAYIQGGLSADQIEAVIRRNLGQVAYCYEKGLQKEPSLSGRVAVKFVINPSGSVKNAKIFSSSLDSRNVESCIVSKLRSWRFPQPVGNVSVNVTYPFDLRRAGSGTLAKSIGR
jgi:TonB family protein